MKIFRWRAIGALVLFIGLVGLAWTFYVDRVIRRTIEVVGTEVMGAKVDLASARLRLLHGDIVLRGLEVTDPRRPMTNLFQAGEIVADLDVRALLEGKAVVETLAVREVRFGAARRASGAIARRYEGTGLAARQVYGFLDRLPPVPEFSLSGLAELSSFGGVDPDSLQTPRLAQAVAARGDSIKAALEAQALALDPTPVVDSARALADRLTGQTPRTLGVAGTATALNDVRRTLDALRARQGGLLQLRTSVAQGLDTLRRSVAALEEARRADLAWARTLVRVPSLAAPDLSASLFQRIAMERLQPVMHWVAVADGYVPAGMRPRENPGPVRLRMAGTTFTFPKARNYPTMLVQFAEASLAIAGSSAAAGAYQAVARGITTEPAVYGRPLTFALQRSAAAQGPDRIRVAGLIDRVGAVPRDSLAATITGVALPGMSLGQIGARLDLGASDLEVAFARHGEDIHGRWHLRSDSVVWSRMGDSAAAAPTTGTPAIGSRAWANGLLWRAVSGLRNVEIDARITGRLTAPRMAITSNVGDVVSANLRREIGAEVARAEARVREEVDRIVQPRLAAARTRVTQVQSGVQARVNASQARLDAVQADLEARLGDLGQTVPARLPTSLPRNLPRIPRP